MKRSIFIIKVFILLKAILAVLLLISILALASEHWTTINQIEGRELISTEPKGLAPLLVTLLSVIITLLFDFKVLKLKRTLAYKHWSVLLLLTVGVIIVSIWLKIQWLTICLMLLLSLYTIYLLFKFSSDKNES